MNLEWHIKEVLKFGFFQLRHIAQICAILSFPFFKTWNHVFVSSHLDYCNSLFTTLKSLLCVSIMCVSTPVLANLHWLPREGRIHFKLLLIT